MELLPIHTPTFVAGDNLAQVLCTHANFSDGDILVLSSKALATTEGAAMEIHDTSASDEARVLAKQHRREPGFCQAVLDETVRMNGEVIASANGFLLTELQPNGMQDGSILVPNAGLDRSNVEQTHTVGWPKDPVTSLRKLRDDIRSTSGANIALVLSDSSIAPRRKGVVAFALCVCGFDPFISLKGTSDIFGHALQVTEEASADQLATAANMVMGNSNQSVPAAIVREHGIAFSDFCGWVPGIRREEDLYHGVI